MTSLRVSTMSSRPFVSLVSLLLVLSTNCLAFSVGHVKTLPTLYQNSFPPIRSTLSSRTSTCLQVSVGPVVAAWEAYNVALESQPLLVKSVTACILLGAADLTGQAVEALRKQNEADEESSVDVMRAVRFAIFGLVLQAPWNHFYYSFLDGAIPPTSEPLSATNLVKIGIDQFIQAPIFTVLIFVFLGLLEGKTTDSIERQLKTDYKNTIIANCTFRSCQMHRMIRCSALPIV